MTATREYKRAHAAVYRARGAASGYACINCGDPASDWAYQHTGDPEIVDEKGMPYANDPDCYAPMCRLCHRRFDISHGVTAKHSEAARANAVKARAKIDRTDPVFLAKMREAGRKSGSVRRICEGCDMESSRVGIGKHQRHSGHSGYHDKK